MGEIHCVVSDEVFERFPGYARGVVWARDVTNGESPPALVSLLRAEEEAVRGRLDKDLVAEHPRIASWRDAFRKFGAKPAKFRSSIEAMVRRVLGGNQLPSINALVDIGNLLSLRYLVPTGGHSVDEVEQDLVLRVATGEEEFVPFGSDRTERPDPGEIVFAEGTTVVTRRWSWRQANHTLTSGATTAIEFNVDGLPPVPEAEVEAICRETIALVQRFCGGSARYQILNRAHPRMVLTGP